MISHALIIVINEMNKHFEEAYGPNPPQVALGNLAEGFTTLAGNNALSRNMLYLSIVNIKEEKTLKNLPNRIPNETTLSVTYENPPVFLNFMILLVATHTDYAGAILALSRVIRFFQSRNVFTHDNVDPKSMTPGVLPPIDQLVSFKMIFDLYSPTLEEINHLWGTLGGKQSPFVLYIMRMLELKFKAVHGEGRLITEVVNNFIHKTG